MLKLANKTLNSGMHRTLSRSPKGKGWAECEFGLEGMMCKPEKVKEAIEYFKIAYEVSPDIVALNQITLGYETLGERERAVEYYKRMKAQAKLKSNDTIYSLTADLGLARCKWKNMDISNKALQRARVRRELLSLAVQVG